ncbi:hypothetical protein BKD26_30410 [Streptomyces sp. CB03238]|nr:hypothetical protein BKD26_30410 [Streptomyces sp. CB03238]
MRRAGPRRSRCRCCVVSLACPSLTQREVPGAAVPGTARVRAHRQHAPERPGRAHRWPGGGRTG